MKAVFVIDVDKDELGEAVATITTKENDITFFAKGVIRPLPQKLKLRIQREWITDYDRYEIGYNACLEKIENG